MGGTGRGKRDVSENLQGTDHAQLSETQDTQCRCQWHTAQSGESQQITDDHDGPLVAVFNLSTQWQSEGGTGEPSEGGQQEHLKGGRIERQDSNQWESTLTNGTA